MYNSSNNGIGSLPLVVCVATPERKLNYRWFDDSTVLDKPELKIMTEDDIRVLQQKGVVFPSFPQLNDLFILHPYDTGKYIRIEDVEKASVRSAKFFKYKKILQELGAISYKVNSAITKEYEFKTDIGLQGGYSEKASAKLDVNNGSNFKEKMGFVLGATFDGVRTVSEQSYNNAKALIEKYRLQDDEFIGSLVDARNPSITNHQRTEHLRLEVMSDFNRCVDVAASFNMVKIFEFSANVKHSIEHKEEYILEIDVTFPEQ